jgi:hypothetical protein
MIAQGNALGLIVKKIPSPAGAKELSNHQRPTPISRRNRRPDTGAEFQKVAFDAVAEDDAVFGHL